MNEIQNIQYHTPLINSKLEDFEFEVFQDEKIKKMKISDFHGRWLVLFFYPADFTFVCPTELSELADNYEAFKQNNAEIVSVSTDTVFVHKAWHDESPVIKKITFPMAADPAGVLARALNVYIPNEGLALRGTFVFDPDGFLKVMEVHDNSVGRSAAELLRKIQAANFVREHNGEVCPASWKPGAATLKPGLDLVGKI
ncbi:MAG: redoxin domain-containing protein [Patescibacteria group bacterium]|jgi:peroxiredoxin (alkyl hydroperoxide reductase subunit C)